MNPFMRSHPKNVKIGEGWSPLSVIIFFTIFFPSSHLNSKKSVPTHRCFDTYIQHHIKANNQAWQAWDNFVKQHEQEHRARTASKRAYPLVSFIFPVFDRSFALKQALNAIYNQHLPFSFEIIALDNYSCDNTAALLESYARTYPNFFLYKTNEHKKKFVILNEGIAYARGKYICPLDAEKILVQSLAPTIAEMEATNIEIALLRTIEFFENFQLDITENRFNLFTTTKNLGVRELLDDTQALFVDRSICVFVKKCWHQIGGIPSENRIPMWAFLFELATQAYEIQLLEGTCHYREWSHRDNIIPLWDYDYDYGHEKKPKAQTILNFLSKHSELFRSNLSENLDIPKDDTVAVGTVFQKAAQFLHSQNALDLLMQARALKRDGRLHGAIDFYELAVNGNSRIQSEFAEALYALGSYYRKLATGKNYSQLVTEVQ